MWAVLWWREGEWQQQETGSAAAAAGDEEEEEEEEEGEEDDDDDEDDGAREEEGVLVEMEMGDSHIDGLGHCCVFSLPLSLSLSHTLSLSLSLLSLSLSFTLSHRSLLGRLFHHHRRLSSHTASSLTYGIITLRIPLISP